jgi:molecular chaperone IbpA
MTNLQLRSIDIPQLHRFGVGFDSMFDRFEEIMRQNQQQTNYPPFNIVKHDEDTYTIEVAVAGFGSDDITVQVHKQKLTIEGKHAQEVDDTIEYLHRGISARQFVREWTLAEHVVVRGATQENGILRINLVREIPEEARPKTIDIKYIK